MASFDVIGVFSRILIGEALQVISQVIASYSQWSNIQRAHSYTGWYHEWVGQNMSCFNSSCPDSKLGSRSECILVYTRHSLDCSSHQHQGLSSVYTVGQPEYVMQTVNVMRLRISINLFENGYPFNNINQIRGQYNEVRRVASDAEQLPDKEKRIWCLLHIRVLSVKVNLQHHCRRCLPGLGQSFRGDEERGGVWSTYIAQIMVVGI